MGINQVNFFDDVKRGKIGEDIFKEDFLEFLNIQYRDVSNCQAFQIIDSDFLTKIGLYEIKANYNDNEMLVFEDYSNYNEEYGEKSLGWIYKTKADLIIFVSKKTRTMVFLPFNDRFKKHYATIREQTELKMNYVSIKPNGNKWQSAFRKVPFSLLEGYISIYKKK
jgi:hypothetical protein